MKVVKINDLARFIRSQRKHYCERQSDLASELGVAINTVGDWERGKAIPSIQNLEKLAKHFHKNVQLVFTDEGTENEVHPERVSKFLY